MWMPSKDFDACFFCLGASSVGMSEEDYRRLTYDLTVAVARQLLPGNPRMIFEYISGEGTDANSRQKWARVKAETEAAVLNIGFRGAYAIRPGFIQPIRGVTSRIRSVRWMYALTAPVYPVLQKAFGRWVISTDLLAAGHVAPRRGRQQEEGPEYRRTERAGPPIWGANADTAARSKLGKPFQLTTTSVNIARLSPSSLKLKNRTSRRAHGGSLSRLCRAVTTSFATLSPGPRLPHYCAIYKTGVLPGGICIVTRHGVAVLGQDDTLAMVLDKLSDQLFARTVHVYVGCVHEVVASLTVGSWTFLASSFAVPYPHSSPNVMVPKAASDARRPLLPNNLNFIIVSFPKTSYPQVRATGRPKLRFSGHSPIDSRRREERRSSVRYHPALPDAPMQSLPRSAC